MNKKILAAFLIGIIIVTSLYLFLTMDSFVQVQKFGGFPVPEDAEIIKEEESSIEYNWSKASEENGIPKSYQKELENEGWKSEWREGAATMYKKDNMKVVLISTREYLAISMVD